MTKALRFIAALLFALPLCAQAQRLYSQPELDQMLAPVALYPDPLLLQILIAATFPDEVRQAADWSRANPDLHGDEAVRAVQYGDWDPSVKSLAAFPQLLQRMAENPQWMQSLGEAFVAQEPHVMDAIQQLRRRAQAAGNLQSSEQLYVQQQGAAIVIQPGSAQYVYVPYYDPLVVYGSWWWPAYRPVHWAPWPGYARRYGPGVSGGFLWGRPVGVQPNFFSGNVDWHRRHWPRRGAAFAERRAAPAAAPVQLQPQVRTAAQAAAPAPRVQAPTAVQPPVRMPAAVAPQQPRAARVEPRHEHRDEPRNHHAPRGRERS